MRIGIVGWGVEGQSAYRYLGPDNDYLIVSEEPRDDFPPESPHVKLQFLTGRRTPGLTGNVEDLSYLDGLEACDKIIYTAPAAKNLERKFGRSRDFWQKAVTIQHIFFEEVKTKNIIGVTGTKGKGTTSTLIYEMLKASDQTVFLGGNIGVPVLDFVKDIKPDDWVVLELSNFQLYNLTYSPHIGVCLTIAPEHLDWHPDMEDYIEAKANLFRHQKSNDIAIYFAENDYSKRIASYSAGRKIPFYATPGARVRGDGMVVIGKNEQEIINKTDVKLLGEHNLQNICAACTAVFEALGSLDKAKTVLSSFPGLEHRLEFVRQFNGVDYYDDSFGTNPGTAMVALRAFDRPKVIILGGIDKGLPFDNLIDELASGNVRQVILIGQTTDKLAGMLRQKGFTAITEGAKTMPEVVQQASHAAKPGDVVLLSTAASSFDMFKDYKDRGKQFKAAVRALS
ncbi:MAG TPA: UDP-N-acetylmuramoyl-L-alanine--D-glutamate ligase [Candidatus Saccharimonadales bacterium]|nr:UDP-N-acetylmuramoyl-L-alanine--D-glutamate ligase [Candidatus Saccharimonadales bacterium]